MFKQRTVAPADWLSDLTLYGVSRNKQALCYSIRFSVWGKQLFIGNADSLKQAGRLYDLALWKFLPKSPTLKRSNYPDDFGFITQRHIDEEAPRLNALYAELPFQSPEDASVSEDELRERVISGEHQSHTLPSRNLANYHKVISRIKRLRLALEADSTKLAEGRLMLPHLLKLPAVRDEFINAEETFALLVTQVRSVETLMESQRAFYQKLASAEESR